ncbi:MAG: biotin synthase BioB [Leptospiraceae bacterium]|nr:biotin synthase BioB [Leptospiraceae bacterium]MCP5502139.1 biotin synthase BioB [Leptospiraceae bacterium]
MAILLETNGIPREKSIISKEEALSILDGTVDLTTALDRAYTFRKKYFSKTVQIHILDNIKNGYCPEDCGYCAQRKDANSGVQNYPLKPVEEIYKEAVEAKENGAYRFCMVTSGTGPGSAYLDKIIPVIEKINTELNMKVCLSAGFLDEEKALRLKNAGLDRYNHNINTSEGNYSNICSTHGYGDRLETLEILKTTGIGICSGLIVGMGESFEEMIDLAFELKRLGAQSIPVNFFIPVAGHAIKNLNQLNPELCIRILCVFRLVNPDAEIRIGAGREGHLRGLQSMGLYPANSLFASGYLNVKGSEMHETVKMIRDAGFEPELESGKLSDYEEENHLYSEENIKNLYKYRAE